jgi:predicted DsbA family dithiol-disulfide isomerase
MMSTGQRVEVDFFLDAACRWAWWASIWIRRVARERPVAVTWKLFSLAVQDNPDDYTAGRSHHIQQFNLLRALALARRRGGNTGLDRLFIAYGNALFGSKDDIWATAVQGRCLEAAGLSPTFYEEALADPSTESDVITETRTALAMGALGTPSLALAGTDTCMLGPIIGRVPDGEAALRLWDNVYFALTEPYIYELKRNRQSVPDSQFAD